MLIWFLFVFTAILPVHQKPETPLLRTHGTAHLPKVLSQGIGRGVWTVDVFRKVRSLVEL